ncbi:hypothetical protein Pyn_36274 [Prunus yedoensis var. nudiflora]|uniref:Uncharacterized protein n=1 Tax=Prunus yedoensis var. nudiflora TaxID=2094558 RepID=A0A315A164_PRUYE|nr:hypothetical protein Pyn_36274 [Prunus yedoensis var. nudiflora]
MEDFKGDKVGNMVVMAEMVARMLAAAEGRKESAAKGWRLMAAGMLAAVKGRKEDEFLWLLGGLQQPRKG